MYIIIKLVIMPKRKFNQISQNEKDDVINKLRTIYKRVKYESRYLINELGIPDDIHNKPRSIIAKKLCNSSIGIRIYNRRKLIKVNLI